MASINEARVDWKVFPYSLKSTFQPKGSTTGEEEEVDWLGCDWLELDGTEGSEEEGSEGSETTDSSVENWEGSLEVDSSADCDEGCSDVCSLDWTDDDSESCSEDCSLLGWGVAPQEASETTPSNSKSDLLKGFIATKRYRKALLT